MEKQKLIFLGINITGGKQPYTCALLDDRLAVKNLENNTLEKLGEILAGQEAIVAVNAPSDINQKLMQDNDIRFRLHVSPKNGRYTNLRVADYELLQMGIKTVRVPDVVEKCPVWVKKGFTLYRQLREFGFQMPDSGNAGETLFEINAEAVFSSLLGFKPYEQKSLEGRLQRQLLLFEKGLDIIDPMEFFQEITRHRLLNGSVPFSMIYHPGELSALAAAYMAWFRTNHSQKVISLGDVREGLVFLPQRPVSE